jgi:hypothetical protein
MQVFFELPLYIQNDSSQVVTSKCILGLSRNVYYLKTAYIFKSLAVTNYLKLSPSWETDSCSRD